MRRKNIVYVNNVGLHFMRGRKYWFCGGSLRSEKGKRNNRINTIEIKPRRVKSMNYEQAASLFKQLNRFLSFSILFIWFSWRLK